MRRILTYLILTFCTSAGVFSQNDSMILSENNFLFQVLRFHPLAISAELLNDQATAYLRKARGAFDPKLSASGYSKDFEGKHYYSLPQASLSIPTRIGADIKTGWMDSRGIYVNPERNYPLEGQMYIGADIPIGRGLFADERRNHLQKAKIYRELNEFERLRALNDLVLDASAAYWKWYKADQSLRIAERALSLTSLRYQQTKESFLQGDLAAVDTLEARIQLQNREITLRESQQDHILAVWYASQFLWNDRQEPMFIAETTRPEFDSVNMNTHYRYLGDSSIRWYDSLLQHPVIRASELKIDQVEADIRYWKEQLKPQFDLSYMAIAGRNEFRQNGLTSFDVANNHIIGFKASAPLFIRKERGSLQLSRIEQEQMELDLLNKRQKIYNTVLSEALAIRFSYEQLELIRKNAEDYRLLLEAENVKFRTGESSLFLVNTRENSYVASLKKVAEMESEMMFQLRNLYWWLGKGASN